MVPLKNVASLPPAKRALSFYEEFKHFAGLKAYLEAIRLYKTDADLAKATVSKWTKVEDQTLLDESYRTTVPGAAAYPLVRDADL